MKPAIINAMEQNSSSEANSNSASQGIPRLLQNPNVRYRVHKSPHLAPYPETDETSPPLPTLFT